MTRENQKTVGDWVTTTFPGGDNMGPQHALRLLDEAIELCWAAGADIYSILWKVRASVSNLRQEEFGHEQRARKEAGDVQVTLYGFAARRGFDLGSVTDRVMEINRGRRWMSNGDGTGYHIKEEIRG